MSQQPSDMSMLQNLQGALGNKCPSCGQLSYSNGETCENCGEDFAPEEEEQEFSYVQAEGTPLSAAARATGISKIPLEESRNLILLQDAVDAVQAGEITLDQYQDEVGEVLNLAWTSSESFKSDAMKEQLAKIPEEYRLLVEETGQLWEEYYKALTRMMQYDGDNISIADEGLQMVEEVLWKMDKLQDRLILKAGQLQPEVEKERQEAEQQQAGPPEEETDNRTYA